MAVQVRVNDGLDKDWGWEKSAQMEATAAGLADGLNVGGCEKERSVHNN